MAERKALTLVKMLVRHNNRRSSMSFRVSGKNLEVGEASGNASTLAFSKRLRNILAADFPATSPWERRRSAITPTASSISIPAWCFAPTPWRRIPTGADQAADHLEKQLRRLSSKAERPSWRWSGRGEYSNTWRRLSLTTYWLSWCCCTR